ncbi:MAG TPA: nucleotide exchange factor GrpE, partial [Pseudobdellovibrionaceae bacterium]
NYMEALSSEPTNEIPPGHVARVFKKAYKLHDKVIRPAQVVVAKQLE